MEVQAGVARRSACPVPDADRHHFVGQALRSHFLQALARRNPPPLVLRNERTGLLVATTLEPAFDSTSRKRGLLGRDGLGAGHALIIAPSNMVHTFFMRFAIDILIVSRDGRVAKAATSVPARRIVGSWRGFAVVEMRAGALSESNTRAGDIISLVDLPYCSAPATGKVSS